MDQPAVPCHAPAPVQKKKKKRAEETSIAPPPKPAESSGWKIVGIAGGALLIATILYFLTKGSVKTPSKDLASFLLALPPLPSA